MTRSSKTPRSSQRRLSRRDALKAGAGALAATALATSGCTKAAEVTGTWDDPSFLTPTATKDEPRYGGHLVAGTTVAFGGLDPQLSVDSYVLGEKLHGYLHSVDLRMHSADLQMAGSYEQVDETTYVWKLKPGIKFHNIDPTWGREVTAEDVVYSMTRRRDDPSSQNDKQLLRDYTAGFSAPDALTFKLVTSVPYSPTLDEIGNPSYAIVPREAVEKWGNLQQQASGCGAYVLKGFDKGQRVDLVKNPDFYMKGLPYLDSMEINIMSDESALSQAFATGRHDAYAGTAPTRMKVEEWKRIKGVNVRTGPNFWRRTFMLRVDKPPFNDSRVRQALDTALDRPDLITKMAFGDGKIAGPIVPDLRPWALPQDEVDAFYRRDVAQAKQLLAAAGYEDGLDVELKVQSVADLSKFSTIAMGHLQEVGIRCKLVIQELGLHLAQTLYPGNFEMTCYYNLPYSEPDRPLCQWFSKGQAGISFSGYRSAEADDWIWKERSEFEPDKRTQIILDAQRFFMKEHGPQVGTVSDTGYGAYWQWLHGIDANLGRGTYLDLGVHYWLTDRRV
jgi:ABC-type transport system substrate-binding protein